MNSSLQRLEWDSSFFGFTVARVQSRTLTTEAAAEVAAEADSMRARCVYFLSAAESRESWRAATAIGFEPVDIRVELEFDGIADSRAPRSLATSGDLPDLLAIVREGAFGQSRFYRDDRFPREKATELFDIWTRRGVTEPGWFTVVEPGGFVSAREEGSIELVALAEHARGRGAARRLVNAALAELAARGAKRVTVATQGGNIAAQRVYIQCGFQPSFSGLWLHRWRDSATIES